MIHRKSALTWVRLLSAVLLLCAVTQAAAGEIHLSVAASLREAAGALADSYTLIHPGVKFVENAGASGALARQIENGAPADLFFSAGPEWSDYLLDKRLVERKSLIPLAYNSLVLIGRGDRVVTGFGDIAKLDRIAVANPGSAPAGRYAMEALQRVGLAGPEKERLVFARDVRECLLYAERGEVDGAFVYRTDALQARNTKILFSVPPVKEVCVRHVGKTGFGA